MTLAVVRFLCTFAVAFVMVLRLHADGTVTPNVKQHEFAVTVLQRHTNDEFADVLGQTRPTSLRLPSPEQLETLAMPADVWMLWIFKLTHYQKLCCLDYGACWG